MSYHRVAAWIDLDAAERNILELKSNQQEGTKICAVIKTDGYGCGAVPIAKKIGQDVDFFAVATLEEAMNLRAHQIRTPILILGHTPVCQYPEAIMQEIRMNIYTYEQAESLSQAAEKLGRKALVHLKLETGMNRLGFRADETSLAQIEAISRMPGITLEGIFSHFFASDEADKTAAQKQYQIFTEFTGELEKRGIRIPVKHIGNSAAMIDLPQYGQNMVRAGIALYGLYPSDEVNKRRVMLWPILRLTAPISFIKTVEKGETIGYGATYTAKEKRIIATIPCGYGDGYPRQLSNKGYVLIHGKKAPITGRVCMDQFMVDITDIPDVKEEEEAVLVGTDQGACITVEELADLAGTFNYEFLCDLGKRIPRIYLSEGKIVGEKNYYFDPYEIDL